MQITRRDLFRTSAVVGGTFALGGLGLAEAAVAGAGSPTGTTLVQTLAKSAPSETGWRTVVAGAGEPHVLRTNLGVAGKKTRAKTRKALVSFAQLSDVHIVDAQSPMRLEPYDRKGDPDDPATNKGTYTSAWRPQETLAVHVADAMVRRINEIGKGPVLGQKLSLTIQTGDNSDNKQLNEIRWNIDVLDGSTVRADSGDLTRYEGVQDTDTASYDTAYWHPDGAPEGKADDQARTKYGFPTYPGLLDAARAPFDAEGLSMPWYTAIGNHDNLPQGTVTPTTATNDKAIGTDKVVTLGKKRTVTADPDRRELSTAEWVEEHFTTTGLPVGHGFTQTNRDAGTAYYTFDTGPKGIVRFVVLDTVNPNGKETGSLDAKQFSWLKALLKKSSKKLVILFSHHPIPSMTNQTVGPIDDQRRVLGPEILEMLLKQENVIAWVNGHTHTNQIWSHKRKGGGGFWEINTASHIDWPQQARLLELADNKDGTLSIFTTMVDHAGPVEFSGDLTDPVELAGLSRQLSANDWQEQDNNRLGKKSARNTELIAKAPSFLRKKYV